VHAPPALAPAVRAVPPPAPLPGGLVAGPPLPGVSPGELAALQGAKDWAIGPGLLDPDAPPEQVTTLPGDILLAEVPSR